MPTVIITIGIPASGKTTWATAYANTHPGTVVSCRDDIRAKYDLPYGKPEVEQYITTVQRALMAEALLDGHNVIVADTNIVDRFRKSLISFAHYHGADVIIELFPIDLAEATRRDALRENPVGDAVLYRFNEMYLSMDPIDNFYIPLPKCGGC